MLAVDPEPVRRDPCSTDTEVVFYLALTLGLEDDPIAALERTVGVIESAADPRVEGAVQATFGVSDGESLWAVRYATRARARSLFASADVETCAGCTPTTRALSAWADDRLIVSEPFSDLPGVWRRDPRGLTVTVRRGGVLEAAVPAAAMTDVQASLKEYRDVREELERAVLPLATSVDGRRFSFQTTLYGLELGRAT